MTVKYETVEINGFRVPATFHDAILKIKDGFQKGKIDFESAGNYVIDGSSGSKLYCPIGYLLKPKQREALHEFGNDNDNAIGGAKLWGHFGEQNLLAMLSMSREDASELQNEFDEIGTDRYLNGDKESRQAFNQLLNDMLERPNFDNPALAFA